MRRCAVLRILTYREYVPVLPLRAPSLTRARYALEAGCTGYRAGDLRCCGARRGILTYLQYAPVPRLELRWSERPTP